MAWRWVTNVTNVKLNKTDCRIRNHYISPQNKRNSTVTIYQPGYMFSWSLPVKDFRFFSAKMFTSTLFSWRRASWTAQYLRVNIYHWKNTQLVNCAECSFYLPTMISTSPAEVIVWTHVIILVNTSPTCCVSFSKKNVTRGHRTLYENSLVEIPLPVLIMISLFRWYSINCDK